MNFAAHIRIRKGKNGEKIYSVQSVKEHSIQVATLAANKLASIGLYHVGYLAGILHDIGKLMEHFQNYLWSAVETGQKYFIYSKPVHSTQSVVFIHNRWGKLTTDFFTILTTEILEIATGGHHGIFNILNADGENILAVKENREEGLYMSEVESNIEENLLPFSCLDELFEKAKKEVVDWFNKICEVQGLRTASKNSYKRLEFLFYTAMLARVVLSAVMDADKQDTITFMQSVPESYTELTEARVNDALKIYTAYMKNKEENSEGRLNEVRASILNKAIKFANRDDIGTEIRRMDVPTGGGKTLTSLGYALHYAKNHNKRRIIYVIPYMSIIEQNSEEIRKSLGNSVTILEHHSNATGKINDEGELQEYKTIAGTWGSDIIVTTQVQFMNTFFKAATPNIRRLNALIDSVIILDEVQTMPIKCLGLFNSTMNFLKDVCNCEIVLSSATMPCFEDDYLPLKISKRNSEIVVLTEEEKAVFKRTKFENLVNFAWTTDTAVRRINQLAKEDNSVLMVCNLRSQVRQIYSAYVEQYGAEGVYFLTTDLCTKHRMRVIDEIKERLSQGLRTVCITTALVECGVDFSFNTAIRCALGMDNIVQTAGRCNRNGENKVLGKVYVVQLADENLNIPALYPMLDKRRAMFNALNMTNSINNSELVTNYFRYLHSLNTWTEPTAFQRKMKYEVTVKSMEEICRDTETRSKFECKITPEIDATIYDWFAVSPYRRRLNSKVSEGNPKGKLLEQQLIAAPYRDISAAFNMIEEDTVSVIVKYDAECIKYIEELREADMEQAMSKLLELCNRGHRYAVDVFRSEIKKLEAEGAVEQIGDLDMYILKDGYYDEKMGLQISKICVNSQKAKI